LLTGLEPAPALAANVRWELLAANRALGAFLDGDPTEPTAEPLKDNRLQ
jgi:hypothetical protein